MAYLNLRLNLNLKNDSTKICRPTPISAPHRNARRDGSESRVDALSILPKFSYIEGENAGIHPPS